MEFTFTEEQKDFQKMARDFTEQEIIPRARELDEQEGFPHENLRKNGIPRYS